MTRTTEQTILDGVILAREWLDQARLKGNPASIKSFERILEGAIKNYKIYLETGSIEHMTKFTPVQDPNS